MIVCPKVMGKSGSIYPMIKSIPVSGVVYRRCKNALSRSFAIKVAEKSVIKDNPNTVIPGVKVLISNKLAGIFACMALSKASKIKGNPKPNVILSGSRDRPKFCVKVNKYFQSDETQEGEGN